MKSCPVRACGKSETDNDIMNGKTKGILSIPIAAPGFSGMSVCVHQAPDLYSVIGYVLICGAGIGMFFFNKSQKTSA